MVIEGIKELDEPSQAFLLFFNSKKVIFALDSNILQKQNEFTNNYIYVLYLYIYIYIYSISHCLTYK